jgi:hypothetical protein
VRQCGKHRKTNKNKIVENSTHSIDTIPIQCKIQGSSSKWLLKSTIQVKVVEMNSCKCRICNAELKHPEDAFFAAAEAGWCPEVIDWCSDEYIEGPFCPECQENYMTFESGEAELEHPILRCMEMAMRRK